MGIKRSFVIQQVTPEKPDELPTLSIVEPSRLLSPTDCMVMLHNAAGPFVVKLLSGEMGTERKAKPGDIIRITVYKEESEVDGGEPSYAAPKLEGIEWTPGILAMLHNAQVAFLTQLVSREQNAVQQMAPPPGAQPGHGGGPTILDSRGRPIGPVGRS